MKQQQWEVEDVSKGFTQLIKLDGIFRNDEYIFQTK